MPIEAGNGHRWHANLGHPYRGHADLGYAMGRANADIDAVVMHDDWLAPRSSLQSLLPKSGDPAARLSVLDAAALGARATISRG